jgi:hypothetical protein
MARLTDVVSRHYETWHEPHAIIDTAGIMVEEAVASARQVIAN